MMLGGNEVGVSDRGSPARCASNRWELVVSQAHACELESEQPICRNREPPLAVSHDNFSIPIDSKLLWMREARSANSERADDPPKSIHSVKS